MSNNKSIKSNYNQGRVCMVIGVTGGVGQAVVDKLIASGYQVILVGKKKDALDQLFEKYLAENIILKHACNLNQPKMIDHLISVVKNNIGKIDCIVNCSGVFVPDDVCVSNKNKLNEMINVNFMSTFFLLEKVHTYDVMNRKGAIVNISSIRGRTGVDGLAKIYSALKAGTINFTKSFAHQYAKTGVRVNCIAPGPIYPTKMSRDWDDNKRKKIIKNTPLGFMAEPKNIADVVHFLVSDESLGITGETIDVNGGMWMN